MKEKKRAKQRISKAEQKVRVVTAFRGLQDNDLDLQVGDEVTILVKVTHFPRYSFFKIR